MVTRLFLALSALLWLPYGLYCFMKPDSLAETAGVTFTTSIGSTELRAMYGGLQAAMGALAGLGALRAGFTRSALLVLAFLTAGLATARMAGLALDGGFSNYTAMGLGFEIASAVASIACIRAGRPLRMAS